MPRLSTAEVLQSKCRPCVIYEPFNLAPKGSCHIPYLLSAFAAWVILNIRGLEGASKHSEGTANRRNFRGQHRGLKRKFFIRLFREQNP